MEGSCSARCLVRLSSVTTTHLSCLMGELSPEWVVAVKQWRGRVKPTVPVNKTACEQALGDVQQTLGK